MNRSRWPIVFIVAIAAFLGIGSLGECGDARSLPYELLHYPVPHFTPSWTPDGQHIVFGRYVIDVGGTDLRSIVPESQTGGKYDFQYSSNVSPIEPRVVYMTLRHGDGFPNKIYSWDIVTSDIDGSDYERLTTEDSLESNPIWSPDGRSIAFFSDRDTGNIVEFNLFVMDRNGSNVLNLAPGKQVVPEQPPVWSPTSDKLAFLSYEHSSLEDRSYDWVLYVVNSDGSDLRRISRTGSHLAWSPDGQYLAFMMNDLIETSQGSPTIVIVKLTGTPDTRKIPIQPSPEVPGEHIHDARALTWSQDGSKLQFVTCHIIPKADGSTFREVRVYSLEADGSAPPEFVGKSPGLRSCLSGNYTLAWSPDRALIAAWRNTKPKLSASPSFGRLFTILADGTGFKNLIIVDEYGSPLAADSSQ